MQYFDPERKPDAVGLWVGSHLGVMQKAYPAWRHHRIHPPLLVNDTSEDDAARLQGYDAADAPLTANKQLVNWYWDLEDMSARQLLVYAREEYGVNLPHNARQETLLKAVLQLGKHAPQNRNRMVLMAHTIALNYDETIEQIRRMAEGGTDTMTEVETEEFEV